MKILEYIERVYQVWDGTEAHAGICLRYIQLAIDRTKLSEITDIELIEFIKPNEE